MLLVIDNYDSFTYNLVQYFGELAAQHPLASELRVERNDALTIEEISALKPDAILHVSWAWKSRSGRGVPGCAQAVVSSDPNPGRVPGASSPGTKHGGRIIRASELMHGKTSPVHHRGEGVFAGLPQPSPPPVTTV